MAENTLEMAMAALGTVWGPLTTDLAAAARSHVEALAKASPQEPWLAALHRDRPASRELYRHPRHGFVLMAHAETAALYRPPHDHGRSWVVYAVQQGESEMGTYARVEGPDGLPRLVRRDVSLVKPGQAQLYLPGDIHDTLCVSGPALLFRFTERDLRDEDLRERRVTRYVRRDGFWTTP